MRIKVQNVGIPDFQLVRKGVHGASLKCYEKVGLPDVLLKVSQLSTVAYCIVMCKRVEM